VVFLDTPLSTHLFSFPTLITLYLISSHPYTPLLSHLPSPLLSYHTLSTHVIPCLSPPTLLHLLLSSSSPIHKHINTHTHTHTHTLTHTHTHTRTGCGLGRLPLEIAAQGYSCQGNEYSAYVTLCYTCPVLCCVMI
jgi:N2227-like protein